MMSRLLSFCLIMGLLIYVTVTAQVPNQISYQGLLTTSAGTPIQDGSYDLQFDIYNLPSGGVLKHTQTLTGVPVSKGTFSVILTPPSKIFSESLFVEVTALSGPGIISPITFSPRSILTTAPYAFRTDTANYAFTAGSIGGVAGGDLTGMYPNPVIAPSAVTSAKIQDGTIQRADVQSTFKAPYSDTSDFAKAANPVGTAGGDLSGSYPNPAIATNAVTSTKILDGTIGAVDIRDTTIITSKIKDAAITTSKIAANAVHGVAKAYRTDYNYWSRSSNWQSIPYMSVSIITTGGPVLILYTGGGFSSNHGQGDDVQLDIAIFRNNEIIATNRSGISDYDGTADKGTGSIGLQYLDFPPAGTHTYEIKLLWDVRDEGLYQNVFTPNHGSNSLTVIEFKR